MSRDEPARPARLDPGAASGPEARPRSRRSLLRMFGAAVLGLAGGAAARTGSAAAADGTGLVLGQSNTSSGKTAITNSGALTDDGAFVVDATAADWAVEGSSGQLGVLGSGFIGVMGTGDVGGFFTGNLAAISLQPQDATGAPTSGAYSKGDILVDGSGVLYLCVADGNPGTWIKVSHGGYRPLAVPWRAYDSRQTGGKLPGGTGATSIRTVPIAGVADSHGTVNVPSNALAIAGNLTITQAAGSGFATVWPDGAWPGTSNINYEPGVNLANSFSVGLSSAGTLNVAAWTSTHFIIDVAAYIL